MLCTPLESWHTSFLIDLIIIQLNSLLGVVHTTGDLAQCFLGSVPNLIIVELHSLLGVVHTTGEFAQFFVGFLPNLVIVQLFSLLGVMHTTEELGQSLKSNCASCTVC